MKRRKMEMKSIKKRKKAVSLCHYLDTHRQQLSLVDKAVLEIGAGTGLVSVVAALLGAWVTATDLPVVLSNLRVNLSRNTRGRCRHTPQVAALSWGYDLENTYPTSVYHYDYVLAADVVYHHDFLDELLVTMKHFCKPGTTLIWANKVRFETDLTFTENFKMAFHTSLLAEDGEMKIFKATCREEEGEGDVGMEVKDLLKEDGVGRREEAEDEDEPSREKQNEVMADGDYEEGPSWSANEDITGQVHTKPTHVQQDRALSWAPGISIGIGKDIYHYAGQDILIHESIDSYGAVMWPAALALCSFLDNNRQRVNLQGKEVLELGSGTGLVTIVASLLGASVTATDLPEVLGNLRANVMRNTRDRCRHTPQVKTLSWGYDLENTYPTSVYHYDYVLAADVVYHHDFLDELLVTMKHFCQPGTTLIWANKVRFETDLTFTENFKKAFHTSLLAEDGEMKIFTATCRD
ncbi:protein-lysine methyltransferase METTL21C isoform X2 [Acanthopagrus latus]|uniref:protein-lysine methyltransferase METTL21C isoform X2 n=1 Tax=Acanthopagrus latus TaxID=8177 RepID=UPI00187C2557|nr:protein-lysine methyltransferase METTL21C isoform X2 [Acanthopagrus latus]